MHSPVTKSHFSTSEQAQIPLQFLPNLPIGQSERNHDAVTMYIDLVLMMALRNIVL